MSGNLNQSVRRTITNTPPIVSLMKSSPKARIPANKKRNTTREFFSKQLLKNEDLFTIMLSFVLSLFLEQKQYGVSVAMLPMQKRYNEFIKSNREPTAKPLLYLQTVKRKWNIMFRKYPKRRGNYSMWP